MKFKANNHIIGKTYDLTQENMQAMLIYINKLENEFDAALMAINLLKKENKKLKITLLKFTNRSKIKNNNLWNQTQTALNIKLDDDKQLKNIFPYYWICFECATQMGGKWPSNHIATTTEKVCEYCQGENQKEEFIAPWVDYNWLDLKITEIAKKLRD